MNKAIVLKTLALAIIFAFSANAASAQKNDKKSKTESRQTESKEVDNEEKEPKYMWVYSVATVTDLGGKFNIEFEQGANRNENKMVNQTQELGMKMASKSEMLSSETDILNFLAEQNFEIISIAPVYGKEGKTMKYYFKTKVELPNY